MIQLSKLQRTLSHRHENIGIYNVLSPYLINENESRLTKGTDELSLYRPGDCLDQRGRGETSKQHVVKEDDVEVPKPVIPTKVSQ